MKDFCIIDNTDSNILQVIGEALGQAGVNIHGLSLTTLDDTTVIHLAVEDENNTLEALEDTKIKISSISDVYVFDKDKNTVTGKPGSFGEICKKLREYGLQINFGYPAENNRFIFGIDNFEKALQVIEQNN